MCTNRLGALDPALRRRAAEILQFQRPDDAQRRALLGRPLGELGFSASQIEQIVAATGPSRERPTAIPSLTSPSGFCLRSSWMPTRQRRVTAARAVEIAKSVTATPPFQEKSA